MHQQVNSHTDVYIWRGRDENGNITTSSDGWSGRVGHAAIDVVRNGNHTHMSLWPEKNEKRGNLIDWLSKTKRASLEDRYEDYHSERFKGNEEGKPDVIVRLFYLNTDKMLEAFGKISTRVDNDELYWSAKASDTYDATDPKYKKASCASLVWTVLRYGGIDEKGGFYKNSLDNKGPKNREFFELLKCNIGQRAGGWFDGWFWTKKFFTPYALCLRVGSAAEASPQFDKKNTMRLMRSNAVAPIPGESIPNSQISDRVVDSQQVVEGSVSESAESSWSNKAFLGATVVGIACVATVIFRNTR